MTTDTKMMQTISSMESALGNLHSFALETQDQEAKKMYQSMANFTESILSQLKGRLNYIQDQEPQYQEQ